MIHDRAYNRKKSWSKALRKYHIDTEKSGIPRYNNLHQYQDSKIHCSCPMCSAKTNNKCHNGPRGWEPSKNWSISDQKKINSMEAQLMEETENL